MHWQFFVDNTAFDRRSVSDLPRAAAALLAEARRVGRVRQARQARGTARGQLHANQSQPKSHEPRIGVASVDGVTQLDDADSIKLRYQLGESVGLQDLVLIS